ncbi:MAG: hypothetical protein ACI4B3_10555 [Prevotella sp.]
MASALAAPSVLPQRYDYARGIEQCCQKDKGDGDRKRETTNEARAETKLALAMPCKEEEAEGNR